jgi:hypothetical protein
VRRNWVALLLLVLCACQMPGDRTAMPPLPEKLSALPYAELLTRARRLAAQATDTLNLDRWNELEDTAREMEQLARFLTKADDVPENRRATLPAAADELGKQAIQLREAAAAKDAKKATNVLARINLLVRDLRLSA